MILWSVLCYNLHKLHIEVLKVTRFGKFIYIVFFGSIFLILSVWDYFKNGDWSLLKNFFFSLWLVIFLLTTSLLNRKTKNETKKAKN